MSELFQSPVFEEETEQERRQTPIAKIPEPVKKREDGRDNAYKKRPRMEESKSFSYWRSDLSSDNVENVNVLHDKPLIAKIPEPAKEREDNMYKKRPRMEEESKSFPYWRSDLSSENVANVNVLHDKPLIAKIPEPVKKKEDGKDNEYKKRPPMEESTSPFSKCSLHVSSPSMINNDFNKVKTFDIRGVTEDVAKPSE